MSPRRDFRQDMQHLAAVIERRMTEYDFRHRRRFRRDSTVSDILNPRGPLVENPGVFTVRDIATRLETTVGDLLGEPVLGEADLQKVRDLVDFLIVRFDLIGRRAAAAREQEGFSVSEEEFVERDYDYPRPHHVWIVPHVKAAAGAGIEGDAGTETTEVLHSIHDVYNGQLRVIRVIGESMMPMIRNDDKVIVDTRLTTPRDGQVVAVYHNIDGGILGYWHRAERGKPPRLEKANEAFKTIRLDPGGGWTLWGTATRIVDTPILQQPRR
jgi:hypothetical protein